MAVVPASVQNRGTLQALGAWKARWPSLREAIHNGAFAADWSRKWANPHGMHHCVVQRDPAQNGFAVLKRRWVMERSFAWLAHRGGLLRDRAGRLDAPAARIAFAAALSGAEALIDPMPLHSAAE